MGKMKPRAADIGAASPEEFRSTSKNSGESELKQQKAI